MILKIVVAILAFNISLMSTRFYQFWTIEPVVPAIFVEEKWIDPINVILDDPREEVIYDYVRFKVYTLVYTLEDAKNETKRLETEIRKLKRERQLKEQIVQELIK